MCSFILYSPSSFRVAATFPPLPSVPSLTAAATEPTNLALPGGRLPVSESLRGRLTERGRRAANRTAAMRERQRGRAEPNTNAPTTGRSSPPPPSGSDRALRRAGRQRPRTRRNNGRLWPPAPHARSCFLKNVWKERSRAKSGNSNDLGTCI